MKRSSLIPQKKREMDKIFFTYSDIGKAIQQLMNNLYRHEFNKEPFSKISFGKDPFNKQIFNQIEKILSQTDEYGRAQAGILTSTLYYNLKNLDLEEKLPNPAHELFIFCILLQRPLMAELFLNLGTNQIISYLVGSTIFKSYSLKFEEESEYLDSLAKDFEKSAINIVKKANEYNSEYAKILILRQVPEFGRTTCLQVAKQAYNISLISSSCVQEFMDIIWYNKISPDFSFLGVIFLYFMSYSF